MTPGEGNTDLQRLSIDTCNIDDELYIKVTGLPGLKENFDRILQEQHPSLAKTNLKVADFFSSKENKEGSTAAEH